MKSSALDVGDYVAMVDADWRPVVEQLRAASRDYLAGFEEAMAYGMPTHLRLGKGCIRYQRPDQIEWPIIRTLLRETKTSAGSVC